MSLPSSYSAILSDLNREVLRAQPSDPLQFCANWFSQRLEQERSAARAQASASSSTTNPGRFSMARSSVDDSSMREATPPMSAKSLTGDTPGARSSSPSGGKPAPSKGGAARPSSLAHQGYAFGAAPGGPRDDAPSPFSEYQPGGGPSRGGASADAPAHGASRFSQSGASRVGAPTQGRAVAPASDSEEEVDDPRDNPNYRPGVTGGAPFGGFGGVGGAGAGGQEQQQGAAAGGLTVPSVNYNLGRRTSVSAESLDPDAATQALPKTIIPKTPSQRQRIEKAISNNLLFRNLDVDQHTDVLNAMKEVTVQAGTEVIVQGAVGDFFYVVEEGTFEVWVRGPPTHSYAGPGQSMVSQPGEEKKVATYGPGGSFGELALMYNAPRAATVVATSRATMWALDRVTFRSILVEHTSRKRKMYEAFLGEVSILQELNAKERAKIADALEEKVYDEGEQVVVEGEVGKNFYIIESGRAEVTKRKRNAQGGIDEEVLGVLGKGDYFGGAFPSLPHSPSPSLRRHCLTSSHLLLQSSPSSTRLPVRLRCALAPARVACALPRSARRPSRASSAPSSTSSRARPSARTAREPPSVLVAARAGRSSAAVRVPTRRRAERAVRARRARGASRSVARRELRTARLTALCALAALDTPSSSSQPARTDIPLRPPPLSTSSSSFLACQSSSFRALVSVPRCRELIDVARAAGRATSARERGREEHLGRAETTTARLAPLHRLVEHCCCRWLSRKKTTCRAPTALPSPSRRPPSSTPASPSRRTMSRCVSSSPAARAAGGAP